MDAVKTISHKQTEESPDSPSTLVPPAQYDCEAVMNEPKPQRCTWRRMFNIRELKPHPKWDDPIITRKRKKIRWGPLKTVQVRTEPDIVEECEEGYPRLAAFLSSEQNFSLYRGFSYLHSRVLLGLQDRIVALERELDKKDHMDVLNGLGDRLCSRARDECETDINERSRGKILDDIRELLEEY
ncbi:hypothetical protein MMC17_010266, partial [Xylographa soralifera]|nr:hypothetical protein [Xylographa soralifera]